MNIQEQEERDYSFGAASEMQNCFAEAQMKCAELNAACKVEGSGRYRLTVKFPYYCRSTDAFAGMYAGRIFESDNFDELLRLQATYMNDEEVQQEMLDKQAPANINAPKAPISETNSENVPF